MNYTIQIYSRWKELWRQNRRQANIELPNGAKCNFDFYWKAVELGILSIDD